MKQLTPYLIFEGTCKDAMTYYADCLNGKIPLMQTFAESPIEVSEDNKERIFNSQMVAGDLIIRASDNLVENRTISGTNFSLFVTFSDPKELEQVMEKLSRGGTIMMPLGTSPSGNMFTMFKDKFNIQWMMTNHSS